MNLLSLSLSLVSAGVSMPAEARIKWQLLWTGEEILNPPSFLASLRCVCVCVCVCVSADLKVFTVRSSLFS